MQHLFKKIHYLLLICFVFSLPFSISHVKLNSFLIILLTVNAIPLFFLSKKESNPGTLKMMIVFVSVYLICALNLFNSNNFHEAIFELQKKLSLLLFPIVMFYSPKLSYKEIKAIVLSFVLSCLLTGVFCLLIAAYRFFTLHSQSFFFYHDLSAIVGMHAAYLSMYFCFSIAILLYIYFEESNYFSVKDKIIFYTSISFLVIIIILLAGRTQLLLLIIGSIMYFVFRFNKNNSLIKSIFGAAFIGVFILGLVLLSPKNRERFKEVINYNGEYSINQKWGEQQMRPLIWGCALELIKTSPITGVGTGDVQDELQKCYIDNKYGTLTYWENTRFNAHNQFLEIATESGIVGLLVFLTSLFVSIKHALKQKKIIYCVFILLFAISCLTESLLERQSGIVFFAFFNSFFYFNNITEQV